MVIPGREGFTIFSGIYYDITTWKSAEILLLLETRHLELVRHNIHEYIKPCWENDASFQIKAMPIE